MANRAISGLHTVAYFSIMKRHFTERELRSFAAEWSSLNSITNVTGVIFAIDDHFFQILEGSVDQVSSTFEKIKRDSRHRGVTAFVDEAVHGRAFPNWAMRFVDLTSDEQILVLEALGAKGPTGKTDGGTSTLRGLTAGRRGAALAELMHTKFKPAKDKNKVHHLLYALETVWAARAEPVMS